MTLTKRIVPVALLLLLVAGYFVVRPPAEAERRDGGQYTVMTEDGRVLLITGMRVTVGDQYVAADADARYEIFRVGGDTAYARVVGQISRVETNVPAAGFSQSAQAPIKRSIGIYSTHSGESYIPSDGKPLLPGRGGIYAVGTTMKNVLAEFGIETILSETIHRPSGRASPYIDSRRTAAKLLQSGVDAIFDLHRDTAPAREYAKTVEGKEIAKILIVLGLQNPMLKANEDLAFRLRDKANELYPGLLRGIYYARGTYNQDLSPQAMLIEIGSAGNSKEDAEAGMALFATTIPPVLYGITHNPSELRPQMATPAVPTDTPPPPGGTGSSNVAYKVIAWLLTLTGLGSIFFLVLNEGSLTGIRERLTFLKNVEFTNYLGRQPKQPPDQDETDDNESDPADPD